MIASSFAEYLKMIITVNLTSTIDSFLTDLNFDFLVILAVSLLLKKKFNPIYSSWSDMIPGCRFVQLKVLYYFLDIQWL